jgi:hypothetical protein
MGRKGLGDNGCSRPRGKGPSRGLRLRLGRGEVDEGGLNASFHFGRGRGRDGAVGHGGEGCGLVRGFDRRGLGRLGDLERDSKGVRRRENSVKSACSPV